MTTSPWETKAEYLRRMADDGGGGLASPSEVEANIQSSFSDLGTVYTDSGDIPSTATVRPAGSFLDAHDARMYLENGGLIAIDNSGDDVIPMGFVYFLKEYDDVLETYRYTVYIDEDTDP